MPRKKVYLQPRKNIHFRIEQDKFNVALKRSEQLGFPTFNKYLLNLLEEDLIVAEVEYKKLLLKELKGEK